MFIGKIANKSESAAKKRAAFFDAAQINNYQK